MVSSTVTTYGRGNGIDLTAYHEKGLNTHTDVLSSGDDDASESDFLLDKRAGSLNGSSEDSPGYFTRHSGSRSPVSDVTDRTEYEEEEYHDTVNSNSHLLRTSTPTGVSINNYDSEELGGSNISHNTYSATFNAQHDIPDASAKETKANDSTNSEANNTKYQDSSVSKPTPSTSIEDNESVKSVTTNLLNPKDANTTIDPDISSPLSSASKRAAVAAAELNDDVLVGTRVSEGHENFVTAYNMLTGIRVAVSRCTAKNNRPLTHADFLETDQIGFHLSGGSESPSSKYIFQFKDYAPWVFRHLRDAFKLDPADYLMSLTSKYIVSELGSPGKSGSFFYYSRDYRFIIKTIHHSEHRLLRKVLKQYYGHIVRNPNTLVSQFYGLHRVRLPFGRKIHFVVMNNVFPALYEIHERYDLKGSLLGREYKPQPSKPIAVFKDLDWMRRHKRIILGPEKRERLIKQLEIDVRFLETINVMDYSLLVGVHSMQEGNAALNALLRLAEFGPQDEKASQTEKRVASAAMHHGSQQSHTAQKEFTELQHMLQKATPERLKEFDFADEYRSEFYFYHEHGGFMSTDDMNADRDVIYYIGIIDFLTPYNFRKSVETFCKSLVHDRKDLSAIPAQEYGERFLKFLRGSIGPEIHGTKSQRQSICKSHQSEHIETSKTHSNHPALPNAPEVAPPLIRISSSSTGLAITNESKDVRTSVNNDSLSREHSGRASTIGYGTNSQ